MKAPGIAVRADRQRWMDILRGLAILLVVHYHSLLTIAEKFPDTPDLLVKSSLVFAPLRMPVLVFLSGLLVANSLNKGTRRYFGGKATHILYPYAVWSVIMYGLYRLRESLLDKPMEFEFFEALLFEPIYHLWFLYYLFFFYVIAFLLRQVRALLALGLAMAVYALLYRSEADAFAFLLIFFLAGTYLGRHLPEMLATIRHSRLLLPSCLLVVLFCVVMFSLHHAEFTRYKPFALLTSLALMPLLIRSALWKGWQRFSAPLEYLGRHSMVYYLLHVPITMVVPIVIQRLWIGNETLVYPLFLVFNLAACTLLVVLSQHNRLVSLLFAPGPLRWLGTKHRPPSKPPLESDP
jgi:peptidoglycan/LPS O-acetylase OafA/YrhL